VRPPHLLIPVDPLLRCAPRSVTQVVALECPSPALPILVTAQRFGSRSGTRLLHRSSVASASTSKHTRQCELSGENGSILLGFSLVVVTLLLAVGLGGVGAGVAGYVQAAGAADAAALAAAPVTFRPFGAAGSPAQEAARFASANGTRLVRCTCPVDRSWVKRTVVVEVKRSVTIVGLGRFDVSATSRATFEPTALLGS
jgi:hypothetical protein